MKPIEPACLVPPEIKEAAILAEQRKDAALDRLQKLVGATPPHQRDAFESALRSLIDADRALQEARKG